MASLPSPEALPRPATSCQTSQPATPQLRDSCYACAASKVKCNKIKPVCGRCAKRGTPCEYIPTKRAGRKRDCRINDRTKTLSRRDSLISMESSRVLSPGLIPPPTPPMEQSSAFSDPDILPDILSPENPSSSSFIHSSGGFDDFFASLLPFPPLEASDYEIPPRPHKYSTSGDNDLLNSNDAGTFHIPDDAFSVDENGFLNFGDGPDFHIPDNAFSTADKAFSELPTLSKPRSPPESRASTTSDGHSLKSFQSFQGFQGFGESDSPCSCLIRALGLLKQLFPNTSTACTSLKKQGFDNITSQLPTIQSIVAENKETIEAISTMLQCPCSKDGYLLAIMSIIVFKVLGWYAAAARETPVTDESPSPIKPPSSHTEQVLQCPTVVGSYYIDGEDQGRMAAQLVLSELHRVQRLVNLLSKRLKGADEEGKPSNGEITSPFPATMLNQLETDLRKRLRGLSLEIVDTLRQG